MWFPNPFTVIMMADVEEMHISEENIIDIISAIMAAGVVINTSTHEEHVDATLSYYMEFKKKLLAKAGA